MPSGEGAAKLSRGDIVEAAAEIDVEPAILAAVADVESSGDGFLPDGRPKILFEGHVFWEQLQKRGINAERHHQAHPTIVYKNWTREYYKGGAKEYERMAIAREIDEEAALCSASWGMFQLMGFNHKAAGFPTIQEFVEAHERTEKDQLLAICRWLEHAGLLKVMERKDWESFARRYNGPGYKKNRYDEKLAARYALRVAEGWNEQEDRWPPVTVVLDGREVTDEGILKEGSSWSPLRPIADALGWTVLRIDDRSATVRTEERDVEVDATILGDRGFVRIKDLAEKLNWAPPIWDETTRTVRIQSE